MRKYRLLVYALLISFSGYSQISFVTGYYLNNSGKKVSGLIQNQDWNDNPESFNFKLNSGSLEQKMKIEDVIEFGFENIRFKRAEVKVDLTGDQVRDLTGQRAPVYSERRVFLKYLQDGEADLFLYRNNSVLRYFYSIKDEDPQQLIYKRYLQGGKILVNNRYKQQLITSVNCGNKSTKDIQSVSYRQSELDRYFTDYNRCQNASIIKYKTNTENGKLFVKALVGTDFTGMEVEKGLNAGGVSFDKNFFVRAGVEIEYVMPFNRNKWSLFIQPVYRSFKEEQHLTKSYDADFSVKYNSIELAIGVRHYFFLNNTTKLFLNAILSGDLPLKSEVSFENTYMNEDPYLDEFKSGTSFGIGGGVNLHNCFSLELRYNTSRDLTGLKFVDRTYNLDFVSKFNTASVIFTYTLL
ncbi:PorT family protein [Gillisia sp. M10.2A]|uniref:PorT family protein n=1 Tax=Gillisia lutea TaxID=2909668 RepID=A0ABS9EJD0_9FLAO|nr:PorT family protein [Gillisia lutea]MCF4102294.1 PorT family protein [Gillisia lutea]